MLRYSLVYMPLIYHVQNVESLFMSTTKPLVVIRNNNVHIIGESATGDLVLLIDYFKKRHLALNIDKTVVSYFHLNTQLAKMKLNININNNQNLQHADYPTYLG